VDETAHTQRSPLLGLQIQPSFHAPRIQWTAGEALDQGGAGVRDERYRTVQLRALHAAVRQRFQTEIVVEPAIV
jgi:hypothetical protein